MKNIKVLLVMALILFFSNLGDVFADRGKAHIKIGSIKGASNITYWYDNSVEGFGYRGAYNNAFYRWAGASSGINFNNTTSESKAKVKIYVGSNNLPPRTIASTDYWNYGFLGSVTNVTSDAVTDGANYDQGRIRHDHAQAVYHGFHSWKVAGHEVGHILGMNHFEKNPAHSGDHWMRSGPFTLSNPTATDIAHLRVKWGY